MPCRPMCDSSAYCASGEYRGIVIYWGVENMGIVTAKIDELYWAQLSKAKYCIIHTKDKANVTFCAVGRIRSKTSTPDNEPLKRQL